MRPFLFTLLGVMTPLPAMALPPDGAQRGFVDGANHHLGDASFVALHGRAPAADDGEKERMHVHLAFVHDWLAARPATRPELAARRAELLGYLREYIAAGVTPLNLDVPWRNPVFVDQLGHVCAVGYLIERSVARALVERIAAAHRFDFLEDIDMPEVKAWIEGSGFTLEELASIQPGYEAPVIETWQTWDFSAKRPSDGAWHNEVDGVVTRGAWKGGQMHGVWTRTITGEDGGVEVIGRGELAHGRGLWTSFGADGLIIAQGPFAKSFPEGRWRFFHGSGRVAAEGRLTKGQRIGRWTFYWDEPDKVIAEGDFARGGRVTGTWRHYDARGELLAKTWRGPKYQWDEILRMRLVPRDGLHHEVAEGSFAADHLRIDALEQGGLRLYVHEDYEGPVYYDVAGRLLEKGEGGVWSRSGCAWDARTARAARRGEVARVLIGFLEKRRSDEPADVATCAKKTETLDAASAKAIEALLAADGVERAPSPDFVRRLVIEENGVDNTTPPYAGDLARVLAANMTWYVEWPHIDGRFARVFATLPGHFPPGSAIEAPEGQAEPSVTIN